MVLVGLTGNIACGKSLVAGMLKKLGAEVIDLDLVAHELVKYGSEAWRRIVDEFGTGILSTDGHIDRRKLGEIVFADPEKLAKLERLTHPAVIERLEEMIAASKADVIVVEAIKLIEGGIAERCDSVWVVTCRPEQQLDRLMRERRLTVEEARTRAQAQPVAGEKLRYATVVIDNSGTPEQAWEQVVLEWRRLVG